MFHRIAATIALGAGFALGGCTLGTEPANVLVSVSEEYVSSAVGCGVEFSAEAIGTSRATWGDVQFGTEDNVISTYSGTEFWGTDGISPGEEPTSITLDLEDPEQLYVLHMVFFTGDRSHDFIFGLQCPSDDDDTP